MTLYDKLKEHIIDALKEKEFIVALNFYQICELHWIFNPTSNKINIVEIQNLFESKN